MESEPRRGTKSKAPSRWRNQCQATRNLPDDACGNCIGLLSTSLKPPAASILACEVVSFLSKVDFISCMQVPDQKKFLKGLVVVDNVAYFGIAPHAERQARAEPDMNCELAAVHLVTQQLLFRRQVRLTC